MIRRIVVYWGMAMVASIAWGEGVVSLDSCRAMALRNNKQLLISKARIEGARYQKKEAKAAYLPALDFIGGYTYNQKNISILGSDQLLPIKNANGDFLPEAALIPKEALTFDIQNVFFGALTLTQPVYMGGKIIALNNIANYAGEPMYMRHQGYVSPIWSHELTLKFMKIADEEQWDVAVHDCCNMTKFARGLNQTVKEGKWFGANNFGCEFAQVPVESEL